ncbi:glycine rich RNA binding protein [Striga asiatica]|uniref:Glycine rich RNA binding protein n=1 Tax=Striga asiatica TaxID=4170 RepID=A0A5A7Q706_STRAF|nr:glycine rich RNA binding protein [Striga asiatica]
MSRGFGFIMFNNEQVMRYVIKAMNGKELDGRDISVNEVHSRAATMVGRVVMPTTVGMVAAVALVMTDMRVGVAASTEKWRRSGSENSVLYVCAVCACVCGEGGRGRRT